MSIIQKQLPKGSAEYINLLNKIKILNIIREAGEISRAEIVKQTGISAPTVTRIVENLIKTEKLAKQVGIGESSGGRPPLIVKFNGEENFVIGIDWGRTHIHGVLANLNAEPVLELDIPTEITKNFKADLNSVINLIEQLIDKSFIEKDKLMGIGIAAAGFVNKKNGIIEYSPNFGWNNVDITQPIKKKYNIPVVVDNVSRVMALGELWYGLGEKINDFLFINVGYGIGAGFITEGKPFYGFDGFSGEFGHTKISGDQNEKRECACGKMNCLESYASGRGITETAKKMAKQVPDSLINVLSNNKNELITAELVSKAAKAGDKLALDIYKEAGNLLGISIANLSNILNPATIVLGGKVSNAGDFFLTEIEKSFLKNILPNTIRQTKIVSSSLKNEAAVKGAMSLILKDVLNFNMMS